MDKQTQIKNQMIELQLEIGRDQQVLHETKNRLKDRMAILYALTAELDQIQTLNDKIDNYNEANKPTF